MRKVLVSGGFGSIGKSLLPFLKNKGYEVYVLSRKKRTNSIFKTFQWDISKGFIEKDALEVDAIIHLAGANIMKKRWTNSYKKDIINSRESSLELLFSTLKDKMIRPKVINIISGINYYGASNAGLNLNEDDKPITKDFLHLVCSRIEQCALKFNLLNIRVVILRLGVVIGKETHFGIKTEKIFRMRLGAILGNGKQFLPWIHIDDLINIVEVSLHNSTVNGIYNTIAPQQITNEDFSKEFSKVLNKPLFPISIPKFILYFLLGQRAKLLLTGNTYSTKKILQIPYVFKHTTIQSALSEYQGDALT